VPANRDDLIATPNGHFAIFSREDGRWHHLYQDPYDVHAEDVGPLIGDEDDAFIVEAMLAHFALEGRVGAQAALALEPLQLRALATA